MKKGIAYRFHRSIGLLVLSIFIAGGFVIVSGNDSYAGAGSTGTYSGKGGKENGKESYEMYCVYCHGDEGKGDGPLASSLGENINPRDLTDKDIMSARTDKDLFKVIKLGGAAAGFDEAMPAQGGAMLTDDEINNIILFIRADLCKCKYSGK